jgi:Rrf2 family cysteine metabolism transcriptional repressor
VKISTRSRYGLRALLELALHYGEGPLMMQKIADSQGVSRKYLDSIFASLKTAGLVRSRRGVGGGHLLAKEPTTVKLGDVMRALEGPLSLVDCVGDSALCDRSHRCVTRDVWSEVGAAIDTVLDNITLADLVIKYRDKNAAVDNAEGCVLNGDEVKAEAETKPAQ